MARAVTVSSKNKSLTIFAPPKYSSEDKENKTAKGREDEDEL